MEENRLHVGRKNTCLHDEKSTQSSGGNEATLSHGCSSAFTFLELDESIGDRWIVVESHGNFCWSSGCGVEASVSWWKLVGAPTSTNGEGVASFLEVQIVGAEALAYHLFWYHMVLDVAVNPSGE